MAHWTLEKETIDYVTCDKNQFISLYKIKLIKKYFLITLLLQQNTLAQLKFISFFIFNVIYIYIYIYIYKIDGSIRFVSCEGLYSS